MNWKKTLILCSAIIVVTSGIIALIFFTEPSAQRAGATKQTPMLVEVVPVEEGTFRPVIVAMGSVTAEQEIDLSPRVSGEIVSLSDSFTPGGFVEEGQLLLEIDPADYEAALLERQSALHQAQADLQMELGRQDVAKQDYELMSDNLTEANKSLILREPQLNSARARVEAAEAALQRARLDLQRTRIEAPFEAQILTRRANLGSLVSPGTELAHLVGIHSYWVEVMVPLAKLAWIEFPGQGQESGSMVRIRNRSAWPEEAYRTGQVHRLVGSLESRTRLARVLVSIPDPLARTGENAGQPPLIVGSYVEARIEGKPIGDVIRLERQHLRKNDTVWVMEDGVLHIRELDIVFMDHQYAYVREGLSGEDQVVVTNLSTVTDGAPLRLEGGRDG